MTLEYEMKDLKHSVSVARLLAYMLQFPKP